MKLDPKLVCNIENQSNFQSSYHGTKARGSYNTMRFVMKLRDDIVQAMNSEENSYEKIQAYSTYLHENIHWWQHVGSNFGFIYSLSYPAITMTSIVDLKELLKKKITVKPLIKFYDSNKEVVKELVMLTYKFYCIKHAKNFAFDNKNFNEILKDRKTFVSLGSCYHVLWQISILSLTTVDPKYKIIPKIEKWDEEFQRLLENQVEGFDIINKKIRVSSMGIRAIYEGQAIFNQLQYLAFSLDDELSFQDCERAGMLYGVYYEAFNFFIETTTFKKPDGFLNSVVGLFLLVCDLAINPTNGFPFDIYDYENFIVKNDPGMRFTKMCYFINENKSEFENEIDKYSKDEYNNISKKLSDYLGCISPNECGKLINNWISEPEIKDLIKDEVDSKLVNNLFHIKLFFSKYLQFQNDKYEHPNIFCWIGYHMTPANKDVAYAAKIFNKHRVLFQVAPDGNIKPSLFEHLDEANTVEAFNFFYRNNILDDLILKWICEEGEFQFDYNWLTPFTDDEQINRLKEYFERIFDFSIDNIKPI
ncbi:hypothetical protein FBALC1_07873 [Flavobacteriales bacterium ALC-1]|nr:hypothetical protein FBALC1_07873 [Flavobacteriales bacterium ALC-1]